MKGDHAEKIRQSCQQELVDHGLQLHELLSPGAFGVVFRATIDADPDASYAIKFNLSEEKGYTELQNEISLLKGLEQHSNIIKMTDSGTIGSYLYMRMPLIGAGDLYDFLSTDMVACHEAPELHFLIISQVADGLRFLHSRHIVHNDVKAENILFSEGRAVICDFGMAQKIYDRAGFGFDLVPVASLRGTPHAVPVEKIRSKIHKIAAPVAYVGDVWGYGILLLLLVLKFMPPEFLDRGQVSSPKTTEYIGQYGTPPLYFKQIPNMMHILLQSCFRPHFVLNDDTWSVDPDVMKQRPSMDEIYHTVCAQGVGLFYDPPWKDIDRAILDSKYTTANEAAAAATFLMSSPVPMS